MSGETFGLGAALRRTGTCAFCRREIHDWREEGGYTGAVPDWSADGDYGCDENPCTNEDGCGGHRTFDEVRTLVHVAELEGSASFDRVREVLYGNGPPPGARVPAPPTGSLLDSVLDMIALAAAAHGAEHPLVVKAQNALAGVRP